MKKNFYIVLALSIVAISCKKNAKADVYIDQSAIKDTTASNARNVQAAQNINEPVATNGAISQVQTTAPAGANPEHGQPGHRCDIPVGAPLNSPPGKINQQQQQITQQVQPVVTPQNTQKIETAPGMNPPHGEPGHRCDIAVGAPLNSPPASTPSVTPSNSQTLPVTVAAPQNAGG